MIKVSTSNTSIFAAILQGLRRHTNRRTQLTITGAALALLLQACEEEPLAAAEGVDTPAAWQIDEGTAQEVDFRAGPANSFCPTDITGDGVTSQADLSQLLLHFGQACPAAPNPCPTDINGDGVTSQADLSLLQLRFGQACPPLQSQYLKNDPDAQAIFRRERTVALPTTPMVANFDIQWRLTNALRMLGYEATGIATGAVIDRNKLGEIDHQLAAAEARWNLSAAKIPNYRDIWAPDFRNNMPQTFALHNYVKALELFNMGPTVFQSLSTQCLLANLVPTMCGVLVDMGSIDGTACPSAAMLRPHQIVQSPDFFGFENVRREITASELPTSKSLGSTCNLAAVLVHELAHDVDAFLDYPGSPQNMGYDRKSACSADLMDFQKPGSPFKYTGTAGQQNLADYVSAYAAGITNPGQGYRVWEDTAESITAYLLFPEYFRQRGQQSTILRGKYDYIKTHIFGGIEFENTSVAAANLSFPSGPTHGLCKGLTRFSLDEVRRKL